MEVGHKDFTRKKPDQLVYLELGAGNGGMLLSISEEGFRFRAVSPVRSNGTMPFAFSLDGRHRLEGNGTIEWLEEDGKSGGMRFTDVSEQFQATLKGWLASDSSHYSGGREVTPAAAAPLDTMEKIRQELRSGYPARPRPPKQESRSADSEPPVSDPTLEPKPPDRKAKPVFPERKTEEQESAAASRPFPLPARNAPKKEEPETAASAFLKSLQRETKPRPGAPIASAVPGAPAAPVTSVPRGDAAPAAWTAPAIPFSPAKPAETYIPSPSRPYVPPPEDSFEQAWERAKLSAPPDSPHLGRAAAGGIIAIALAVIVGALAYNFREDIGGAFIQLGQSISGDRRVPAPAGEARPEDRASAQQETAQKPEPAVSRPQSASSEKENVAQPNSTSPNPDNAVGTANSGPEAAKNGTASTANPKGPGFIAFPLPAKPHENSTSQILAEAGAKEVTPADLGTGQEEFNSAREILRGNSRHRDLPRAVDLLWAGVRKGYVPAEVTLADLFRRGDGVEKNCDQARVLLVAASKKGSLDARQMLEHMAEQGCE
jgi:hypothetical protein